MYPTLGTIFRIPKSRYKEPSGDFVPDTSIHKMLGTKNPGGTLIPNIRNYIQNSKSRYKETSGDFVLKLKDQKQLVQRAKWELCT